MAKAYFCWSAGKQAAACLTKYPQCMGLGEEQNPCKYTSEEVTWVDMNIKIFENVSYISKCIIILNE